MKRTKIIFGIVGASIMAIGASVGLVIAKPTLNVLQAAQDLYSITIDKNSVDVNKLDFSSSTPQIIKIRNTEFGFYKCGRCYENQDDGIFRICNDGYIFNTTEDQINHNFSITGFKSLRVNTGDFHNFGRLTAVFSDYANGIGEEIPITTDTNINISKYSKYHYVTFKASEDDFLFSSIKIDYTCVNANPETETPISREAFESKYKDMQTFNSNNPYYGNYALDVIFEADAPQQNKEIGKNYYYFDLENLIAHVGYSNNFHGEDATDCYMYYENGQLYFVVTRIDSGAVAFKGYQAKAMDEKTALAHILTESFDVDTYFEGLPYAEDFSKHMFRLDDKYRNNTNPATEVVNQISFNYSSNGLPGNLHYYHTRDVDNVKVPGTKSPVNQIIKTDIKFNNNRVASIQNVETVKQGGQLIRTSTETAIFKRNFSIVKPDLAGYPLQENMIGELPDEYALDAEYAIKYADMMLKKNEKIVPITGSLIYKDVATFDGHPHVTPNKGTANMNVNHNYDFENLQFAYSFSHTVLPSEQTFAWYENGKMFYVSEKIAREGHPEDDHFKKYDSQVATKEQFINWILNNHREYGSYYRTLAIDPYESIISNYQALNDPNCFHGHYGNNNVLTAHKRTFYKTPNQDKYSGQYYYTLEHCESIFGKDSKILFDRNEIYENGLLKSFTIHNRADEGFAYEDDHYSGTFSKELQKFNKPIIDDTYVLDNSLITGF